MGQQWHQRTLAAWSQQTGIPVGDAQLLRVGHAAAYALPSAKAFIRVHQRGDDPHGDIAFAVAAGDAFLQPEPVGAHPIVWCAPDGTAVTTWPLGQQQPGDSVFDWRQFGEMLATLAERPTAGVRDTPDGRRMARRRLQAYQDTRDHDPALAALFADQLAGVGDPHHRLRRRLAHGDAHPGNTVIIDGRLTVCDYDLAGAGDPIENTIGVAVMWMHYGIGDTAFDQFVHGWGHDPRNADDFEQRVGLRALLYASSCFTHGAGGHNELAARLESINAPGTHIWQPVRVPTTEADVTTARA